MKKFTLLFYALMLFSVDHALAQSGSVQLDERARKHYTEEQIKSLSPEKIQQINFYYSKSFVILKKDKECTSCPPIDESSIDITLFENSRAEDRRVVVFLTRPGYPIELLSWNELKAEYARMSGGKK